MDEKEPAGVDASAHITFTQKLITAWKAGTPATPTGWATFVKIDAATQYLVLACTDGVTYVPVIVKRVLWLSVDCGLWVGGIAFKPDAIT